MLGLNNYIVVTVVNAIKGVEKKPTNFFDRASTIMNAALNSIQASMGNQHVKTDIQKQAFPPDFVRTIRSAYGITGTNFNTHTPYINGKRVGLDGVLLSGTEIILIKNDLNPREALIAAGKHQILPMKTNSIIPSKIGEVLPPLERPSDIQFEVLGEGEIPGPIFGPGNAGQLGGFDDFGGAGVDRPEIITIMQGATGPQGPIGPAGPQGIPGAQGPGGPQGIQGPPGADGGGGGGGVGPPGPAGADGADGADGATGATGADGAGGFSPLWTRTIRAAVQSVPTVATTPITFDVQGADEGNIFTPPNSLVGPIGIAGLFSGELNVTFVSAPLGTYRHCRVIFGTLGGGSVLAEQSTAANSGGSGGDKLSCSFSFLATVTTSSFICYVDHDAGVNLNVTASYTMIRHR